MQIAWPVVALGAAVLGGPHGTDRTERIVKTFPYKQTPQAELAIHVHYPPDWKATDCRPAVVFFFGGGWDTGGVGQFETQAQHLASRGLVTARADYRVKSRHQVTPAAGVADARSAVRWLREHAGELGIDPDRVVAAGGSAGGHLAACTACPGLDGADENLKVSSRPNALLLFNPVLRFDGVPLLLARIGNDEQLGKALSPTLHLTKESPPTLLLYGTEDRLLVQGEEYLARAKELGQRTEMYRAAGAGHGFFNKPPWREKALQQAEEFLKSLGYLHAAPAAAAP